MATTAKLRVGRPTKPPTPGKRTTITAMVSPELKQYVDETARAIGRSQAQQVEYLLQQGRDVVELLELSRMKIPELKRRLAEAVFREHGYVMMDGGQIWIHQSHPAAPKVRSDFIPPKEETP